MDVLTDILEASDLSSSLYFRATFAAPFAVDVPADGQQIRFHVAGPGESWIGLPTGESTFYREGDLILVPHGSAHRLADGPDTPAKPLADVLARATADRVGHLRYPGPGREAVLLCGHFAFNEDLIHPVLESLPRLIHIRGGSGRDFAWLEASLRHMQEESRAGLPGFESILKRLSQVVFVQVFRSYLENTPEAPRVLASLADPHLRRVLEAIHRDPGVDWSLDRLARIGGLSRTLFAERFRTKLGLTPMRYVARWRMQKARALLASPERKVGEVARAVGYSSEAAFNRVFKGHYGLAPGSFRRTA